MWSPVRRLGEWTPLHTVATTWGFYLGILVIVTARFPSLIEAWVLVSFVALLITGWNFRWVPSVGVLAGAAFVHAFSGAVDVDVGGSTTDAGRGIVYYGVGLLVIGLGRSLHKMTTEVQQSEEKDRRMEQLREQEAFKTRFLNMAAHELATPLTPLRLQLTTMLRDEETKSIGPRTRRRLQLLERNVLRLQRLSLDLLEASRLGGGTMALDKKDIDLRDVIEDVIEMCRPLAVEGQVALEVVEGEPVPIHGDADRLGQVIWNLCNNSLKFTPPGGRVKLACLREGDDAFVTVEDTGPGMTEQQQAELFQPFTQFHQHIAGKTKGSGLGLFISRGIAEQHGGALTCTSPGEGQGATFMLRLPVVDAEAQADEAGAGVNGRGRRHRPTRVATAKLAAK